jgi:hypothetical protein
VSEKYLSTARSLDRKVYGTARGEAGPSAQPSLASYSVPSASSRTAESVLVRCADGDGPALALLEINPEASSCPLRAKGSSLMGAYQVARLGSPYPGLLSRSRAVQTAPWALRANRTRARTNTATSYFQTIFTGLTTLLASAGAAVAKVLVWFSTPSFSEFFTGVC